MFARCETLLTSGPVPSLPVLSIQPRQQRRWGSLYDALAAGEISNRTLEQLLTRHPLAGGEPIDAVDGSVWPRSDAETRPERARCYHAARHWAGQPMVAGWAYAWIAPLGFARESGTAPLRVQRMRPHEHRNVVAAEQIRALLPDLPGAHADGTVPWLVFDAGYDPVQLTQALGETPAAILVRLRAGRCCSADPSAQPQLGRRRRHGHTCIGDEAQTWPTPEGDLTIDATPYGAVRVRAWTQLQLQPKTHGLHAKRDARGGRPLVRGTLLLVAVSRLPQQTGEPQARWLWWQAPRETPEAQMPDLERVWRASVRRFALEPTCRFRKPTRNSTLPRVRHPEPAARWTWLVLRASTPLRVARPLAQDQPLPWQQAQPPSKRTPARVQPAFSLLLPRLPMLARAPQPCGRSPGRPKGKRSGRARRYPALTKALLSASHAA